MTAASASTVTPEVLLERARAMIPTLKERARRTVAERNVPDETVAEMQEAGFFRILQPKRYGGYEMHPNVFFEVQKALAEGCMSTGWIYGVVGGHPFQLALFDDKAQQELWSKDDSTLVSSSYQPVGKVERTDGGFYLSGHWGFSSGSRHCEWVVLGALVPPEKEGGAPEARTFLLPRKDYKIDTESWQVFGLQGTGSEDIIVERAFVPEYRTHRSEDGFLCNSPGNAVNTNPMYRVPWAQVFLRLVSTAAIGGAKAAVNAAVEIARSRVSTNTGKASKADPVLMEAIARAYTEIDEIEAVLRRNMVELMDKAQAGKEVPMEWRTRFRFQSSRVVPRLAALVDTLLPLLGGRAVYTSSPIIQPWLDLHAARAHVANNPYNMASDVLGNLLGNPPAFKFL